jgi:hypothetical protein
VSNAPTRHARDLAPPRRVHRGHAIVRGLFFVDDDARARRTILARLAPGDVVERVHRGLVLRIARAERTSLDALPALGLVEERGLLTSSPLSHAERERAGMSSNDASPRGVAVVMGGELSVDVPTERVDPARWIDVSSLALEEPASLGRPPAPIEGPIAARSAREALGVPAASAESVALRRVLLGPRDVGLEPSEAGQGASGSSSGSGTPGFFERFVRGALDRAARAASWLSRVMSRLGAATASTPTALPPGAGSGATEGRGALERPAPRPPSLLSRLEAWLRERARRLGWDSFGRFLARKHAEHLEKLLALLDANDLDEALKHAIPLSNEQGGAGTPSLSLPSPRTDLAISNVRAKGGAALGLGGGLFDHLRRRYRALLERLLALERWKDAAFVLAELLDDAAGAVALLEKHGLYREAAELAEGRELSPPFVVRQWILARDLSRAVTLARRHDAFGPAITRLRATDREAARALALAWADLRAKSGDYLGALAALEAGDALSLARGLAVRWAERGAEVGGAPGAEALVWWLALDGDAPAKAGARLESILRDASLEERHVRSAIYAALAKRRGSDVLVLADAARFAWRAAVRDRALFGEPALALVTELESAARDLTLPVDRPVIVPLARGQLSTLAAPLVLSPSARGAFDVKDAVVLPDRRVLVALGEAGLRVLSPDGRTVQAFDAPADEIVLSDEGTRALVLSFRGSVTVVHRLDTIGRRLGDRFELLGLTAHARTFSGDRWAIALDRVGQVLDVTEDRPRALFRVKDVRVAAIDRSSGFVSFVASGPPSSAAPSGLERLRYEERGLVLRERRALPERFGMEGTLLGLVAFEPDPVHVMLTQGSYFVTEGLVAYPSARERPGRPMGARSNGTSASVELAPGWIALVVEHARGKDTSVPVTDVVLLDRGEQRERLVVLVEDGHGPSPSRVGVRLEERRGEPAVLLVFDALGRVLATELETGRVLADLGVR